MTTKSATKPAPRAFSLVSYNILADAYVRPRRYRQCPATALDPSARRERLLARLTELDADIYCLQEVERAAFAAISDQLGPAYRGEYEPKRGRPDGLATFARTTMFELEGRQALHFDSGRPDDAQLALIVRLRGGDHTLSVANTHLRWQPGETTPEDHIGRAQLLELLTLREDHPDPDQLWLLAGDFNATSESSVLRAALERGWKLSCRRQRPWDTCNISGRRRKIDYVLYENEQLHPEPDALPQLQRDTPMPSEREPSDHLPLRVRFEHLS